MSGVCNQLDFNLPGIYADNTMSADDPGYIELSRTGGLSRIAETLKERMTACDLCPNRCCVDRTAGETGLCGAGMLPVVSQAVPHFGEERPLSAGGGSGTIFFTYCNLSCMFCQNYDISHLGRGREIGYDRLARLMLDLQNDGCNNINLVTPTHMVYPIIRALEIAVPLGLRLPLVWNSGGYDSVEVLRLLEGVVDIYMPDFKYADADVALRLSGVSDYPRHAAEAVKEMHRQVGDLRLDSRGVAYRGLLVRHLVLPDNLAGTKIVMDFLAGISKKMYVNIMDQYHPAYHAWEEPKLNRRITRAEYLEALEAAERSGLRPRS